MDVENSEVDENFDDDPLMSSAIIIIEKNNNILLTSLQFILTFQQSSKVQASKRISWNSFFPSTCQIPSGVNYKTECFFACNVTVGYQLEGAPKVVCLENGSWSADTTKTICRGKEALKK